MKIAVIGNMNNNGFALMRYFRDLGHDAHLFTYADDGVGNLSHFKPEADTWDMAAWRPYVHDLGVANSILAVAGRLAHPINLLRRIFGRTSVDVPSLASLSARLASFEKIVCSGIAPAVLLKAGRNVDIYYPYSTGVEFLGNMAAFSGSVFNRAYHRVLRGRVLRGLQGAKHILNAEMSKTADVLNSQRLAFLPLAIPMVYYSRSECPATLDGWLSDTLDAIRSSDFVVVSPARNSWIRPPGVPADHWSETKHNDWLIRTFAELLRLRPASAALLCLFEYGDDVSASKSLVSELGISPRVHWIPKCSRKEIMLIDAHADVCVGEIRDQDRLLWGGTGWEALAVGKPLLQSFNFKLGEFEELFGMPPPPLLAARTEQEILRQLLFSHDNRPAAKRIGDAATEWFNEHNGAALASRWLELLAD